MAHNKRLTWGLAVVVIVALVALVVVMLALPAAAAPPRQAGPILPTPTLVPLADVNYTLDTVGGSPDPITFTHQAIDGFTLTETTARSLYPAGMTFAIGVASAAGEIESVSWTLDRQGKFFERALAQYDADSGSWIAHPWEEGGTAVGMEGEFSWRIKDTAGNVIETEPQHVAYYDPENVWWRTENDQLIMYWSGFGTDDPDQVARGLAETMGGVEPRWIAAFGEKLSYKPLAFVYPDFASFAGRFLNPVVDESVVGQTGGDGTTVQRLVEPYNSACAWAPPRNHWTMENRVDYLYGVIGHEVTHLYQFAAGGARGPTWWTEGQAEWFPNRTPAYVDPRLRNLATLQELPTLQGELGYQRREADGCTRLAYDAGASFVNWFVAYYGLETLGEVIRLQYNNTGLYDAIEQATGVPFLTLENKWRDYNGFAAFDPADLDPALGLQPYEDPLFAVGDRVTMPALPAMAMIYTDPAPNAVVIGSCWANMEAEILRMGQIDGVAYFEIDCLGQVGWMTRDQLVGTE